MRLQSVNFAELISDNCVQVRNLFISVVRRNFGFGFHLQKLFGGLLNHSRPERPHKLCAKTLDIFGEFKRNA